MRVVIERIARLAGVVIILLAFVQILVAFFPSRADLPSLVHDATSGRTHEVTYFEENDVITVQWRVEYRNKSFTQEVTSLPKEAYEARYVQQLKTAVTVPGRRVDVREQNPSAGWGGVAAFFAPAYISLLGPVALKALVAVVCLAVIFQILTSRDSSGKKLGWVLLCVFTGAGLLAYLVTRPNILWRRGSSLTVMRGREYGPLATTAACSVMLAILTLVLTSTNVI